MKYTKNLKAVAYTTPEVNVCSVMVESGFEASMPGVTINPWEREEDTLTF